MSLSFLDEELSVEDACNTKSKRNTHEGSRNRVFVSMKKLKFFSIRPLLPNW